MWETKTCKMKGQITEEETGNNFKKQIAFWFWYLLLLVFLCCFCLFVLWFFGFLFFF